MRLIQDIKENYKTLSIIGLAKNSGKTETLNYLIHEAKKINLKLGITSTGRDGEKTDLVTETEKPSIYVEEGMIIATGRKTLYLTDAGLELLEDTDIVTPMGRIMICRVVQEGEVQIAGPISSKDMEKTIKIMWKYDIDNLFIDGAVDRKTVSSPIITDGCIIAAGAVLSRDVKKVVEKTSHIIECYSLPEVEDEKLIKILKNLDTTAVINKDYEFEKLEVKTGLGNGSKIKNAVNKDTKYIFIDGALTSSLLKNLIDKDGLNYTLVLRDGTKIFTEPYTWNNLKRQGMKIKVMKKIKIAAVTVNPVSPYGYVLRSEDMIKGIKRNTKVKVFDVQTGVEDDDN
ncbi:MAG: hypothetical protein R6U59_03320 [Eubacteriales bacterium]